MRRKSASIASWSSAGWAAIAAVVGWVFAGGIFYATTGSKLSTHDDAIKSLVSTLKEDSSKREDMRKEYMAIIKEEATKRDASFEKQASTLQLLATTITEMRAEQKIQGKALDNLSPPPSRANRRD
jgi:hypothetical protein